MDQVFLLILFHMISAEFHTRTDTKWALRKGFVDDPFERLTGRLKNIASYVDPEALLALNSESRNLRIARATHLSST